MTATQNLSDIFKPEPTGWGFRGDPYLWQEMASALSGTPMPTTLAQLNVLLETNFARLVGSPPDSLESSVFIERYSHGGISSGRVSLAFWREKGLPLLRLRYVGA